MLVCFVLDSRPAIFAVKVALNVRRVKKRKTKLMRLNKSEERHDILMLRTACLVMQQKITEKIEI